MASGSALGDVAIWDVRVHGTRPAHSQVPHSAAGGSTTGVGMTGDTSTGVRLFSCGSDGSVAVTELRAGRPHILRAAGPPQHCARAFSGGWLSAGEDGIVNVWSAEGLVAQCRLPTDIDEAGSAIHSMHLWSATNVSLVTGHANGCVCWWDPA